MYYIYVLKSTRTGCLYYGYTQNLRRRFIQHNNGESVFTSKHRPLELVYYESYKSKVDALKREIKIKQHGANKRHLKKRIMHSLMRVKGYKDSPKYLIDL